MTSQEAAEREELERALAESERRYRALFDDSPSPIYVFDTATLEFLAANEAALQQYGYTLEEFLRLKLTDIRPEEEVPRLFEVLSASAYDLGRAGPWRHLRKDGSEFDADVVAHGICFDGREARVALVKDVTERRQIEMRLRESEERFRNTFEQAAVGVAHISPDGRWLRVNRKLCDILGYEPEGLIRLRFQDITAPEDLAANIEIAQRLLRGELDTAIAEKRYIRADGMLIWAKVTISLVRAPQGEPSYFITVIEDISQAKKVETEIQLSEARFRALTENSADRTVVLNAGGFITYVSASSTHIFGYTPEEVVGHFVFDFVHPADVKAGIEVFEKLVRRPGGSAHLCYRARHKEGRYLWVDCRGYNGLEKPAVGGIVINERDITEEKALEAQFLRAQRLESVGTLASGIAHDLNNILAPILMSAPMLRTMDMNGEMRESLISAVEASAQRGADIVRQILAFTRGMEGERLLLQPLHILKEVSNIARETFPKNIVIRDQYNGGAWAVHGDPTQLHQVLMNLTINARDAMPHGGTITLAAENVTVDEEYAATLNNCIEPGNYLAWSVTDTGEGIPAIIKDRIFDPFFTTKEVGKGTGLGLSTVIGIVRGHRGALSVESEVGRGTKFTILLPAIPGEVPAEKESEGAEPVQGSGELVLVVDDERAVLELARLVLERDGYRIAIARDGIEGLAVYKRHADEVAMVLTDIHMPNLDGAALVQAIRSLNPEMPIIASSGHTGEEEERKLMSLGADRFLKKPYTKGQLLGVIAELLAKARATRAATSGRPGRRAGR